MNTDTIITITTIGRQGYPHVQNYDISAGKYAQLTWNDDCDGNLPENFFELPITEQLDLATSRDGEAMGCRVDWAAAAR